MKEHGQPWNKLKGVITEGAVGMTGKKKGLIDKIRQEMGNKISAFTWNFTASFTKSHFVEEL
jgi:hypothetical protein